jgi:signal transduction histidine kinase/CheY-like chemotaxis protein
VTRESLTPARVQTVEKLLAGADLDQEDGDELFLPLEARGKPFGALVLSKRAGAKFDGADFTVAEALASRAAIALENARLYQNIEAADRQKNEFLSMLAHELRNPLAPILHAAEILRLAVPEQPQVQWALSVITRQMNHMVLLVDDLLDVSRITSGKIRLQLQPVGLEVVIADAVAAARPAMERVGHLLQTILPPESIWVNGNAARLTQIVTNLFNKAIKYTDPGGRIWVTLERQDDNAVIRVRDTGIGIPPEMLGTMFDLFTQVDRTLDRAQGGLGIGLSLVRRLVGKHGGTVSAFSEGAGKGSEITVKLPAIPTPRDTEPSAEETAPGDLKRLCVLVVDDNVDGAGSLAMLLRMMCREVHVAHHGATGLELALEHRPDIIILDIGLPGISGYDLARRLRAEPSTRSAILLALTGYGRDDDQRRSKEGGFDRHLVKPVDLVELRKVLESLTAERPNKRNGRAMAAQS